MKQPKMLLVGAAAIVSLAIIGCATIKSSHLAPSQKRVCADRRVGIAYYLPKAKLRVVAQRTIGLQTNVDLSLVGATNRQIVEFHTNHWLTFSGTNVAGTNVEDFVTSESTTSARNPGVVTVQSNWVQKAFWGTNGVLTNDSRLRIAISTNSEDVAGVIRGYTNYSISVSQVFEPDPQQLYLLKFQPNVLADDTYQVSVDTNGFLSAVGATNADQTPAFAISLAQLGIQTFELVAGGLPTAPIGNLQNFMSPMFVSPNETVKPEFQYPLKVDITFDPTDDVELSTAKAEFYRAGIDLNVSANVDFGAWAAPVHKTDRKDVSGFYYRPVIPYRVTFRSLIPEPASTGVGIYTFTALLPNKAPILTFPMNRGLFITNGVSVGFQNGMLANVYVHKPSELLGAIQIPLSIVSSVAKIPTDIIQLKINIANTNNALLTANNALLTSQQAEITALTNLMAAQQTLAELQKQKPTNSASK